MLASNTYVNPASIYFSVDSDDGEVKVKTSLYLDSTPSYIFYIRAVDTPVVTGQASAPARESIVMVSTKVS